jgi:hypothetical protein
MSPHFKLDLPVKRCREPIYLDLRVDIIYLTSSYPSSCKLFLLSRKFPDINKVQPIALEPIRNPIGRLSDPRVPYLIQLKAYPIVFPQHGELVDHCCTREHIGLDQLQHGTND